MNIREAAKEDVWILGALLPGLDWMLQMIISLTQFDTETLSAKPKSSWLKMNVQSSLTIISPVIDFTVLSRGTFSET